MSDRATAPVKSLRTPRFKALCCANRHDFTIYRPSWVADAVRCMLLANLYWFWRNSRPGKERKAIEGRIGAEVRRLRRLGVPASELRRSMGCLRSPACPGCATKPCFEALSRWPGA